MFADQVALQIDLTRLVRRRVARLTCSSLGQVSDEMAQSENNGLGTYESVNKRLANQIPKFGSKYPRQRSALVV